MGVEGKRDSPNSVVEGKMKKRGSIITESCNEVGWFGLFSLRMRHFFRSFFGFPSFVPSRRTIYLISIPLADLPPPKLLEQTQMGTQWREPSKVVLSKVPTNPTARSHYPLLDSERDSTPPPLRTTSSGRRF